MILSAHSILTELEQNGKLKQLVKSGYCPVMIFRNLELTRYVDARVKTGASKTQAITDASIQFRIYG